MTESETSSVPADRPATGADEELWLTYLNYDHAIQQAVRRLGALSTQNVEMFRGLLLKDRDRSRVKEYEAESIRRLQGEAPTRAGLDRAVQMVGDFGSLDLLRARLEQ